MTTRSPCLPSCRVLGVGWLRRPWVLRACADCPGAYDGSYPYNTMVVCLILGQKVSLMYCHSFLWHPKLSANLCTSCHPALFFSFVKVSSNLPNKICFRSNIYFKTAFLLSLSQFSKYIHRNNELSCYLQ
jgi:hypothetical protein